MKPTKPKTKKVNARNVTVKILAPGPLVLKGEIKETGDLVSLSHKRPRTSARDITMSDVSQNNFLYFTQKVEPTKQGDDGEMAMLHQGTVVIKEISGVLDRLSNGCLQITEENGDVTVVNPNHALIQGDDEEYNEAKRAERRAKKESGIVPLGTKKKKKKETEEADWS